MGVRVKDWKGAWWVFMNHKGRRKARRVGEGKAGKRAAEAAAEKIQAKLALGDVSVLDDERDQAANVSLREYADRWLRTLAAYLKPSTVDGYEAMMRCHWLPDLGTRPITAITRDALLQIVASRREGEKPMRLSSLHTAIIPLRACLNVAVRDGLISRNPATHLLPGKRRRIIGGEARKIELFSRDELQAILGTAEEHMPEHVAIVATLALAGLRVGEVLTLQVDDVDVRQAELWVQRTWGRELRQLGARQIGSPKSGEAGKVLMSRELVRVLQGRVSLLQAEATVAGTPAPTWLFPEPGRSTPMRPNYFYQRVWRPLLRRAGVRYRKPHTLRHTYASVLLASGAPLTFVRDQLRHASIQITADVYGHLIPSAHRATLEAIDAVARRTPDGYAAGPVRPVPVLAVRS